MALLHEEKEQLLDLLDELVNYLSAKEEKEFAAVAQLIGEDVDDEGIREAKLRDLQRHSELYSDVNTEASKQRILTQITLICPEIVPVLERLEYTLWSERKKERALSGDIMIATDWGHFFELCQVLIE